MKKENILKMKTKAATYLKIDLDAIAHNITFLKQKLDSKTKVLAVVKAFAYGGDSVKIATYLQDNKLCNYLAVAYTEEGIHLREHKIHLPILVLHPQIPQLENCITHCLEPNIYSKEIALAIVALGKVRSLKNYPIHIKFNTGLNRLGFGEEDLDFIAQHLVTEPAFQITSIFSHLAASEDPEEEAFTLAQIKTFKKITDCLVPKLKQKPILHLLNTSGILNYAQIAQYDMVRTGIGMYGFANDPKITKKLLNTHKLYSTISQLQDVKKGDSIGYNRGFVCPEDMRLAILPIGHADGIPRSLGKSNFSVQIHGKEARILGNVCMDMILVDVTSIVCKVGDSVVVFDCQEHIDKMALIADTISYEILTLLSQRVKRI